MFIEKLNAKIQKKVKSQSWEKNFRSTDGQSWIHFSTKNNKTKLLLLSKHVEAYDNFTVVHYSQISKIYGKELKFRLKDYRAPWASTDMYN